MKTGRRYELGLAAIRRVRIRGLRLGDLVIELLELCWQITREAPAIIVLLIALFAMIMTTAAGPHASNVCP